MIQMHIVAVIWSDLKIYQNHLREGGDLHLEWRLEPKLRHPLTQEVLTGVAVLEHRGRIVRDKSLDAQ